MKPVNHLEDVRIRGRKARPRGAKLNVWASGERKYNYYELQNLILKYLPDFCFQSAIEILTMMEQIGESMSQGSLVAKLWVLVRKGKIEKRPNPRSPWPHA